MEIGLAEADEAIREGVEASRSQAVTHKLTTGLTVTNAAGDDNQTCSHVGRSCSSSWYSALALLIVVQVEHLGARPVADPARWCVEPPTCSFL